VDGWVAERFHDAIAHHPLIVDLLRAISTLGRPQVVSAGAAVVALALVARGRVRLGLFVVLAVVGAWMLDDWIKDLVGRQRPVFDDPVAHSSGASFPSGHAMTSMAAYGALVVLVRRRAFTIAAAVLVVAIGLTRIVLGVHWVTDVLGGWVLGAAWLALCAWVVRPTGQLRG